MSPPGTAGGPPAGTVLTRERAGEPAAVPAQAATDQPPTSQARPPTPNAKRRTLNAVAELRLGESSAAHLEVSQTRQ